MKKRERERKREIGRGREREREKRARKRQIDGEKQIEIRHTDRQSDRVRERGTDR